MTEKLTADKVKYFIGLEDQEFYIDKIRQKHGIDPESPVLHTTISRLVDEGIIKRIGRGLYKKIIKAKPVAIFSVERERKPPYELRFPTDKDTGMELDFVNDVVIREGDCILIAGESNWGKTTLAMQFLARNINSNPVLLGNEFTKDDEPTPRFLNRLDTFKEDGVVWVDENGQDKFTLLPVYGDFEDNIVRGRINIIDWINLPGEYYMISPIMEKIKHATGSGIDVLVIQKNAGTDYGRGGAPTKDFADLELLIDKHSNTESRLTIGKCKEYLRPVTGRSWAYEINKGVFLRNVREIIKCPDCYGKGWKKQGMSSIPCDKCQRSGWINK